MFKGIMTILRDAATPRGEFIFFTDRLSTILVERAMEFLPFRPTTVTTPTGADAEGSVLDAPVSWLLEILTIGLTPRQFLCGVTIMRS
jgi:uridine kinase